MARVLCTIFIRQNKKPRLEARRRNHAREHHTDRPEPARDQARPADHREDDADPQRDARRRGRRDHRGRQIRAQRGRKAYRAGHYERKLTAKAGRLELKVPKLKGALFESAVIERYRRREQSVEESLIDMYLAGVSTRQVDDISQLLWGDRMPSQTLSDKLKRIYGEIDQWRTRPLESEYPYVFVDGVWHKRSWGGHVENVSVLVAIGVDSEGHREVIGVTEGMKEDGDSWEQLSFVK